MYRGGIIGDFHGPGRRDGRHEQDGERQELGELAFAGGEEVFVGGTARRRGQRAEVSRPHEFKRRLYFRHDYLFSEASFGGGVEGRLGWGKRFPPPSVTAGHL